MKLPVSFTRIRGALKDRELIGSQPPSLHLIYSAEFEFAALGLRKILAKEYVVRSEMRRPHGYSFIAFKVLQGSSFFQHFLKKQSLREEEQLYLSDLGRFFQSLPINSIRHKLKGISHVYIGLEPEMNFSNQSAAIVLNNVAFQDCLMFPRNILNVIIEKQPSTSLKIFRFHEGNYTEVALEYSFPTISNYLQQKYFINLVSIRLFEIYFRDQTFTSEFIYPVTLKRSIGFIDVIEYLLGKTLSKLWSGAKVELVWSVAVLDLSLSTNPNQELRIIPNPEGRSLADPFVIDFNNNNYIFVEDVNLSTSKGSISVIDLSEGIDSYKILKCLDEEFHMSYPFVFQYEGAWYMCPETSRANQIVLYKCVQFPNSWEFSKVLMRNISAVDVNIFEHDSVWNMTFSYSPMGKRGRNSEMHWFTASSPISNVWTHMGEKPLVTHSQLSRNGGVSSNSSKQYAIRQNHGFENYGMGINLVELQLDENGFKHIIRAKISVTSHHEVLQSHHYSSSRALVAVDIQSPLGKTIQQDPLKLNMSIN